MINNIYGGYGIALVSYNGSSYVNFALFEDVEPDISFSQENTSNEANNGIINTKTIGWRLNIDVEILNISDDSYEIIKDNLVAVINDYLNGMDLIIYPRTKTTDGTNIVTQSYICHFSSDFNVEDLLDRIERAQSISLSFESRELITLPSYIY